MAFDPNNPTAPPPQTTSSEDPPQHQLPLHMQPNAGSAPRPAANVGGFFSPERRAQRDAQRQLNQQKRDYDRRQRDQQQEQYRRERLAAEANVQTQRQQQQQNSKVLQLSDQQKREEQERQKKIALKQQQLHGTAIAAPVIQPVPFHALASSLPLHADIPPTDKHKIELGISGSNDIDTTPTIYYTDTQNIEHLRLRIILRRLPPTAIPSTVAAVGTSRQRLKLLELRQKEWKEYEENVAAVANVKTNNATLDPATGALPATTQPTTAIPPSSTDSTIYTCTFQWQEKLYSPREITSLTHQRFTDLIHLTHKSPTQQSHSQRIRQMLAARYDLSSTSLEMAARQYVASQPGNIHLHTYVDSDQYVDPRRLRQHLTSSQQQVEDSNMSDKLLPTTANTTQRKKSQHHHNQTSTMHLYCTLYTPTDSHNKQYETYEGCKALGYEYCLATLKFNTQLRVLEVTPTLSQVVRDPLTGTIIDYTQSTTHLLHSDDWLTFTLPNNEQWMYRIENLSDSKESGEHASVLSAANDQQVLSELQKKRVTTVEPTMQQLLHNAALQFDTPPPRGTHRYHLYGCIDSCSGFEDDQLYVTYQLQLPKQWQSTVPDQLLSAISQSSHCMFTLNNDGIQQRVAGLNFPFEFTLDNTLSILPVQYPTLYVQVNAIDYWLVNRVVGYGYVQIPRVVGCHTLEIKCWRPTPTTIGQHLRQWFLGETPQLQSMSAVGLPSTALPNNVFNRYGLMTEGSGTVHVRMNVLVVTHTDISKSLSADAESERLQESPEQVVADQGDLRLAHAMKLRSTPLNHAKRSVILHKKQVT